MLRRGPARPGTFSDEDNERFVEALRRPGALTAALNYYRAAVRGGGLRRAARLTTSVRVPTLLVWGERDPFLSPRLTEGLHPWVPDLRVERVAESSHWVQNEAPERVNQSLVSFLRGA
jgi:pimeloyl-ACP methyl ester carboxylesterase